MLLRFNNKLHRALREAAPDGYAVSVVKRERALFTVIVCDDPDYFASWSGLRGILEKHGY